MSADVVDGYAAAATPELIARYEAIPTERILAPVLDLLPPPPARVLDIGAGTGRDAAWFAARGHDVVAVEPVSALREAGLRLHRSQTIDWRDDRLPQLERTTRTGPFDLVLLNGVWHHLDDPQRGAAIATLAAIPLRR